MIRLCIETPSNEIFDQVQEHLFKLGYEWNVSVVRTGY